MSDLENKPIYQVITSDDIDDGDRIFPTRDLAQAHVDKILQQHPAATAYIHESTIGELYSQLYGDNE